MEATRALDDYRKDLSNQILSKEAYLREKYNEYLEKSDQGTSSEVLKSLENEISEINIELQKFTKDAEEKLIQKRTDLYEPILENIDEALKSVAARHKLDCIFQATNAEGVSTVLYVPFTTDLTAELLKEVGANLGSSYEDFPEFKLNPSEVTIGYTNIEMMLASMPEARDMDNYLNLYNNQLDKEIEDYRVKTMAKYQEFMEKKEAGLLSESELTSRENELIEMDKTLTGLTSTKDEKSASKRSTLLNPILEKLQNAIDKVSENNGFSFVLNQTTSSGVSALLYGPDNCDISQELAMELGIPNAQNKTKIALNPQKKLKVGYLNIEAILAQMPQTKEVEKQIKALEAELVEELEKKQLEGVNETEMQRLYSNSEMQLLRERQGLLQPIMEELQTRINNIATSKGYDYILNQTAANILYIAPKDDLNSVLLNSLGL